MFREYLGRFGRHFQSLEVLWGQAGRLCAYPVEGKVDSGAFKV